MTQDAAFQLLRQGQGRRRGRQGQGCELFEALKDRLGGHADKAADIAGDAVDKAKDVAGDAVDTAKDVAGDAADKAPQAPTPALPDVAVVEHGDAVGVADRRQPVGDDDRRASGSAVSRAAWTWASFSLSRWLVASSRIITAGSLSSSRAMAMRCFSPPDRR